MKATKQEMSKIGRLKKRSDFLRVQKEGKKWVAKGLVLQAASNDGLGLRFGLTVTKKVSTKAVVRNRIRRRLKAAAFDVLSGMPEGNTDFVLIGRIETEKRDYETLTKDLTWCLKKLGYMG